MHQYYVRVTSIDFEYDSDLRDTHMVHLKHMTHMKMLNLSSTKLTDAGMVHHRFRG